jgi:phage gp29-like protein
MPRPQIKPYGELILPVFTQWERVGSITGILQSLEQGIFYDAALLVTQMYRDDRVRAVMNVRIQSILGCPMHMEVEDERERKKSERMSEEAEAKWCRIAPDSELSSLLNWGLQLGVGLARKEWHRMPNGEWFPTLKTWHPGAMWFSVADDTYMLNTKQGVIPILPDDPNWLLFTPYGHKYARTEGMMRHLAMLYLCRQWAFRDRARHSERHGMPFLQLVVPAELDEKDKDTARKAISALGTETVSVTPQGMEGNLFDWKLIEPKANSHETFSSQIDHLDKCIAIVALGQSMSTEGVGGLGSQAKAGDTVRRDIMRFDARCLRSIGASVLGDWARFNYGENEIALYPCYEIDPPEDGLKKAQELSQLGDALDKLAKYGVDTKKILEETGIPMLAEEEVEEVPVEDADKQGEAQPGATTEPVTTSVAGEHGTTAAATLALTPSDLAGIVKVDEGRKSVGLSPIGGDIGTRWIVEHTAQLKTELPTDPNRPLPVGAPGQDEPSDDDTDTEEPAPPK